MTCSSLYAMDWKHDTQRSVGSQLVFRTSPYSSATANSVVSASTFFSFIIDGLCSDVNLARDVRKVTRTVFMFTSPDVMITVLYADRHTRTTVGSSEFS